MRASAPPRAEIPPEPPTQAKSTSQIIKLLRNHKAPSEQQDSTVATAAAKTNHEVLSPPPDPVGVVGAVPRHRSLAFRDAVNAACQPSGGEDLLVARNSGLEQPMLLYHFDRVQEEP